MRAVLAILLSLSAFGQPVSAPRKSPSFSILRPGQAALPLESFRGKVVLLALISTTCPHCQELTRGLGPLSKEYAARGVQFLECAFNPEAQQGVPGFIQQLQPPFPVGYADRAAVDSYLQRTVIDTTPLWVPHLVFLDRTGVIRADIAGDSPFMSDPLANIRAELDKLLGVGGAGKKATGASKKGAAAKQ
ncbi:MAG: TlpA disulfide reductase family protein [Bryobacteraceae bacterium]|jgi:thiol-disulfide isomerase/thioredoxin